MSSFSVEDVSLVDFIQDFNLWVVVKLRYRDKIYIDSAVQGLTV